MVKQIPNYPKINPEVLKERKAQLFAEAQKALGEILNASLDDLPDFSEDKEDPGKTYVYHLSTAINELRMAKQWWEKEK